MLPDVPTLLLEITVKKLFSYILALVSCLQAPRTRAEGVSRVARCLYESFEFLYSVVDDPTSGYLEQGGTASIKNTPMQVRTILGVV
jgi:hypothetical protein